MIYQSCLLPKKLDKFFDKKPVMAAKKCEEVFPIKETTDTVTIIDSAMLQAYEMEFVYLYSMLDSLLGHQVSDSVKREIVTVFQEKKVPVIKYKYITKTVESTAKYQILLDSCNKISKDNLSKINTLTKDIQWYSSKYTEAKEKADRYKEQRNKMYWWIFFLIIALFRRQIARLIRKLTVKI
jgi:hypothetical protein